MATNPTLLAMPLAENGTKNVIPETQATAGDGLFSQSTGFPAETSLPLGAGGVAPSREDFNGLANLLGGVAYYAQKGFTFNYDATQDYYKGCVVIDPNDGLRYECIADMAAGTIAPSADTTNTYWTIFKAGLDREQIPAFNHRDVITTSGTYTAPVDGWYKITAKGGGGGGAGGYTTTTVCYSGGGGGEGGTTIGFEYLTAGDTSAVTIGAGGAGGAAGAYDGANGGDSAVVINANTYTGGGGYGGKLSTPGGRGGTGTIPGNPGGTGSGIVGNGFGATGGNGGGAGGGFSQTYNAAGESGTNGGGGAGGGTAFNSTNTAGGNGGDVFVWFEYFAEV